MQCTAPVRSTVRAGRIPRVNDQEEDTMPEGIIGAVWAFCLGLAAASGTLVGAILGLITHLRHRAIAAFMSVGAGASTLARIDPPLLARIDPPLT